jgi:hypothetical protein
MGRMGMYHVISALYRYPILWILILGALVAIVWWIIRGKW